MNNLRLYTTTDPGYIRRLQHLSEYSEARGVAIELRLKKLENVKKKDTSDPLKANKNVNKSIADDAYWPAFTSRKDDEKIKPVRVHTVIRLKVVGKTVTLNLRLHIATDLGCVRRLQQLSEYSEAQVRGVTIKREVIGQVLSIFTIMHTDIDSKRTPSS